MRTQRRDRGKNSGTEIFRARAQLESIAQGNLLCLIDSHTLEFHTLGAKFGLAPNKYGFRPVAVISRREPDACKRSRRSLVVTHLPGEQNSPEAADLLIVRDRCRGCA